MCRTKEQRSILVVQDVDGFQYFNAFFLRHFVSKIHDTHGNIISSIEGNISDINKWSIIDSKGNVDILNLFSLKNLIFESMGIKCFCQRSDASGYLKRICLSTDS